MLMNARGRYSPWTNEQSRPFVPPLAGMHATDTSLYMTYCTENQAIINANTEKYIKLVLKTWLTFRQNALPWQLFLPKYQNRQTGSVPTYLSSKQTQHRESPTSRHGIPIRRELENVFGVAPCLYTAPVIAAHLYQQVQRDGLLVRAV